MTIVQSLEKITDWLQTNVCDKIKLKAPHDDDVKIYEEVNPVAHTLFQPGKSKAPPQTKYQIPSVVVQLIDGADDMVKSNTRMKIQLSFMVWNPGKHPQEGTKEFTRNADGWKDVWNFVDHALQAIENAEYLTMHFASSKSSASLSGNSNKMTRWSTFTPTGERGRF